MRKLVVFLAGMVLFLQHGQAQFPIERHFWLNDSSYNHTLSPTSDGGFILAAAREEQSVGLRNTIAVFKLFPNYQIQNSRIIGFPGGTGGGFDVNVNFEVHDVIENFAVDAAGNVFSRYYVICGSMTQPGSTMNTGMVAIVDVGLGILDIREYPSAEVFYSVYTAGNYYYVCGKTPATAAGVSNGIVLRDEITQPTAPLPVAYITQQPWEYHKVKVNNNGNDLVVSGTDYNNVGFTAFDILGGNFAPIVINPITGQIASQQFSLPVPTSPYRLYSNSKVVVTDNPTNPTNPTGLILAFVQAEPVPGGFFNAEILTYVFANYNQPQPDVYVLWAFTTINEPTFLGDVNTVPAIGTNPARIAWVANADFGNSNPFGMYLAADLPFSPTTPQTVTFIEFNPLLWGAGSYSQLHKVHYQNGDFHCGGFYFDQNNNNKTTLVVSPEQVFVAANPFCSNVWQGQQDPWQYTLLLTTSFLPLRQIPVSMQSNTGIDVPGSFCHTDCDNSPLVPNNCGN